MILLFVSGSVHTLVMSAVIASSVRIVADPVENYTIILLLISSNRLLFAWIGLTEQVPWRVANSRAQIFSIQVLGLRVTLLRL